MLERSYEDAHRRDARLLEPSCDVPDRHVAHGSDGDQEQNIDPVAGDPVDPSREGLLAEPSL